MSGTVNISRSIWTDAAFKDEPMTEREAFVWIIMEASYKPREKRVGAVTVNLERGQLVTSVRFMCEAWNWSKSRVDRFLKRLEKRDMIGTDSGTGINVITVCKYNDYQNAPAGSGTPKLQKRDSNGTAAGQQRDKPNTGLIPEAIQKKEKRVTAPRISDDALIAILSNSVSPDVAASFVQHRKDLRKPMTENMADAIVKKLEGHHDPDAVLTDSIANGWQGIFPEKIKNGGRNGSTTFDDKFKSYTDGIRSGSIVPIFDNGDPFA